MLRRTFSWTALTQLSLAGTQLLLLPVQVRAWGVEATAHWNGAIAISALLLAADFGLRGFGHESLRRHESERELGNESFRAVWAMQRLLALAVLLLAVAVTMAAMWLRAGTLDEGFLWLVVAFALEAVLVARGTYMDTLGMVATAEASYALMASSRLAAALLALAVFDAGPQALAVIYACSAAGALALQGLWLRRTAHLHLLAGGFGAVSLGTLGLVRYSLGYPLAVWSRVSLPVLVLQAIASAALVNAFIALRALFGLSRQAVLQLSRLGSVQYAGTTGAAAKRAALLAWTYAAVFAGTACALAVELDAGTLLSTWVPGIRAPGYLWVSLSLSLTAPFFATQVLLLACMRSGAERQAARLQWAYIGLAALAAPLATVLATPPAFFAAFVACETIHVLLVLGSTRALHVAGPFLRWSGAGVFLVAGVALLVAWSGLGAPSIPDALLRLTVFAGLLAAMLAHARGVSLQLRPVGGWA